VTKEENKMNDLYIGLAVIAGITVWTTFGRAWQYYMIRANNTRKGWGFFFHPFEVLLASNETFEDIIIGPIVWAIEWFLYGMKGVWFLLTLIFGGKLFDFIFKK
jgi:hypothetical protein